MAQDLAIVGWRGFHPGYYHAPDGNPDSEAVKMLSSHVVVSTAAEALDLAETFREEGARRVHQIAIDRQRAGRSWSETRWRTPTGPDREQVLRDLEGGSDRDDYDPF